MDGSDAFYVELLTFLNRGIVEFMLCIRNCEFIRQNQRNLALNTVDCGTLWRMSPPLRKFMTTGRSLLRNYAPEPNGESERDVELELSCAHCQ